MAGIEEAPGRCQEVVRMQPQLLRAVRERALERCEYCHLPIRGLRWARHFRWQGQTLVGLTTVGRTTVRVLDLNHPLMLAFRETLLSEGVSLD